jgi:hypothetical protein
MRWKYYPLSNADANARKQIFENLSIGSDRCPLGKKLVNRFANATGSMFAIAMESLELDRVTDYCWAGTYAGGKQLREAISKPLIPMGDRPIDGLMSLLHQYFNAANSGLVVIENYWTTKTEEISRQRSDRRLAFYQESVYHLLTPNDIDPEFIEDTIREPWHHWFTGVCGANLVLPVEDDWPEQFLDDIVANAQQLFVPAFDDEGFLVWSPC